MLGSYDEESKGGKEHTSEVHPGSQLLADISHSKENSTLLSVLTEYI